MTGRRGAPAKTGWTDEEIAACKELLPFLAAARLGLARSRWRPGDDPDELLAPIVLTVLAEVARRIRPGELMAALAAAPPQN
jgi:hypothetical protein